MNEKLSWFAILNLKLQRFLDFFMFIPVSISVVIFMNWIRKNHFLNLEVMRLKYEEITRDKKPTLICANHLTMFDSIYMHYALNNVSGYFRHFRLFSWNVPAIEAFKATYFMSIFTYLGKCIPLDRTGSAAHKQEVVNKLKYLLLNGETVTLFPEGGRSRTGLVDVENVTYGSGEILLSVPECQVACIYLRGLNQKTFTVLPEKGDDVYFSIEVIHPVTENTGRRGARDISMQIINKLKEMEDEFFRKYPDSKPA